MIQRYREMADDPLRLARFRAAIAAAIRPGDVVVDAGCGLGTYAVFAARGGAARVYAVDDGPVAEVARQVAAANGVADVVTVLRGRTTALPPPEPADLILYEDYVAGLLAPPQIETLRDLRARWLKPGGRVLPGRARLRVALVESGEQRRALDRFADGGERVLGVDLGPARRYAMVEPQVAALRPASLLSAPAALTEVDLAAIGDGLLAGRAELTTTRDGTAHGLLLWFELLFDDGVALGTGPLDPPSAWRQLLLPFDPPLRVAEGDALAVSVDGAPFGASMVWRWRADGPRGTAAAHSLDLVALDAHEKLRPR